MSKTADVTVIEGGAVDTQGVHRVATSFPMAASHGLQITELS